MTISDDIKEVISQQDKHFEYEKVTDFVGILNDGVIYAAFLKLLDQLRKTRPDERGEKSRRYAIAITEMEKAVAYFKVFILDAALQEKE